MNLYEACKVLDMWHIAKPRAEVWSLVPHVNKILVDDLISIVKDKFHDLAMKHHPDRGGNSDEYIRVREAYELIKSSIANHFISALEDEKKANTKYFTPGSNECKNCRKWSSVISGCLTSICTGLEPLNTAHAYL